MKSSAIFGINKTFLRFDMAFRVNESKFNGLQRAIRYLTCVDNNGFSSEDREKGKLYLERLTHWLGPVVDCYPIWHPLMASSRAKKTKPNHPSYECGYHGLDHTVLFAHGFITCPYTDGEDVIESVKALSKTKVAEISATKLDLPLYAVGACPILVECHWKFNLEPDLTIPSRVAVALMLKQALADWERSDYSLDWEAVSYNMLGSPHGQLSSLFINRETGLKMRKAWQAVCAAGVFESED